AKEAVANEKERLSLTLKSIAEGVVATDAQGSITLMNEVAEELTGWSLDDALGKSACQILNIQESSETDSCTNIFNDILSSDPTFKRVSQTELISRSGKKRLIFLSAAPIRREERSSPTGSILVFRDITHEKNMEMECIRSQRIESLGIVAGGIAHDFNNLLTAILGNISLARRMAKDNDAISNLLAETEKASSRAKNLTHQLLTFAKGGAPVTTLTSTRKLIEESARFSSSGSNIKCHFDIADDLWQVEIDEGQIGQVIQNLVINADQTMKQGGAVDIGAENIIIDQNDDISLTPGNYIKIYVKDKGEGIASQYLDKIFDPYFTTKETGHGLGLSICYSIIKKHSGLITVASEQGVGSTFSLYLPAADQQLLEQAQQNAATETTAKILSGQGKLLIMDDEQIIREVASQMLTYLGYSVELAADGEEALQKYRQAFDQGAPFDAVIMDLTIPEGMGGKEAIEHLLRIDPEIKAIVSSGYANDPIMANFKDYGFQGVMPKPFNMEEASNTLKKVLTESDS
ncbi:MAG: response regulator, partial [Proteobacteria bacterium]|nr:response regulator [Pseudomonadota bacterium]